MISSEWAISFVVCCLLFAQAGAQTSQPASHPAEQSDRLPAPLQGTLEKAASTSHEIIIAGKRVKYRATAANMPMKDENGKLKGTMFFVAYEKEEPRSPVPGTIDPGRTATASATDTQPSLVGRSERPITFVFNGGPGAAAVWLHLGTAGPMRVDLGANGEPPPPPYRLIDNPFCWLDATDLVFIDPVGTGFSRPAEGEKAEQFFGVREDIQWVADFIRLYITAYGRWPSPKFLAGESYGTTRAAGLSEYLIDRHGIALNGIVLISTVLDFQTLSPSDNNDLPYPLYLPSYAAIAWYHRKLPADLQVDLKATLREIEDWSLTTYSIALARGATLPSEQRQTVLSRLARYTGLPAALIDQHDLRIAPGVFRKNLLASEQKVIGRFDSRLRGFDAERGSHSAGYDPGLAEYLAIYSSTFNDYVRRVLKYESLLPYEVLSGRVHPWKMTEPGQGYLNVADNLRSAMIKNPHLKILVASGYFDLATPYYATVYTLNRLDLHPALRANIITVFFMGGHMMYHHEPSREKLHDDVVAFIRGSTNSHKR
ncbi:MAG: peptidase S10 [Phycisphaerae bacterium]|nr:peptidase S10 [Phycisphaerae bacterium]